VRQRLIGSLVGVIAALALGAVMIPFRSHLAVATAALVLVVPVVAGVAIGGWAAGLVGVASGFLVYDLAFIPPYGTLAVGRGENWVALAVYVVVMALVARLVVHLRDAEAAARVRASTSRLLLDLSQLLISDSPDLEASVVAAVRQAFGLDTVALVRAGGESLEVVASAGSPVSDEELALLGPASHVPVPLTTGRVAGGLQALALVASGRPIALLVLRGGPLSGPEREALLLLANDLAIALDRRELHELAHRAELLEAVDGLREALMGAVSHDLRTPLATIKVASSTLADPAYELSPAELAELHGLIDEQADRLTRLVGNLLDMTRIRSGALEVRPRQVQLADLLADAVAGLASTLGGRDVKLQVPEQLPAVDADPLLVVQVLANLIDNANRYATPGSPIVVDASVLPDRLVSVGVDDDGPGVPLAERETIFETFVRFDTGGRSGLGLAIAKAFLEAHGSRIWVEDSPQGGARFAFTLQLAPSAVLAES